MTKPPEPSSMRCFSSYQEEGLPETVYITLTRVRPDLTKAREDLRIRAEELTENDCNVLIIHPKNEVVAKFYEKSKAARRTPETESELCCILENHSHFFNEVLLDPGCPRSFRAIVDEHIPWPMLEDISEQPIESGDIVLCAGKLWKVHMEDCLKKARADPMCCKRKVDEKPSPSFKIEPKSEEVERCQDSSEKAHDMDFSEALKLLKRGAVLRRSGWATSGATIKMVAIDGLLPCVGWCVPGRESQPGWLCSMSDMLAEDWVAVNEPSSIKTQITTSGDYRDIDGDWRAVSEDTAFAPPFGTIRACRYCGCLVAGGPTACVRCVKDTLDNCRKSGEGGEIKTFDPETANNAELLEMMDMRKRGERFNTKPTTDKEDEDIIWLAGKFADYQYTGPEFIAIPMDAPNCSARALRAIQNLAHPLFCIGVSTNVVHPFVLRVRIKGHVLLLRQNDWLIVENTLDPVHSVYVADVSLTAPLNAVRARDSENPLTLAVPPTTQLEPSSSFEVEAPSPESVTWEALSAEHERLIDAVSNRVPRDVPINDYSNRIKTAFRFNARSLLHDAFKAAVAKQKETSK